MAASETEWSLLLSDELPEGEAREFSSKATPSTSRSRPAPRVNRSWKAMSYFSKVDQEDINRMRTRYQIPDDVVLRIPDPDERECCPKYKGDVTFYEVDFQASIRFPLQPFVRELLDYLFLASGQVAPNRWGTIISCMVMWRVSSNGQEDLTVDEFLFCYEPCHIALSLGFWTFKHRDMEMRIIHGLPSSNRTWKDGYVFVCGDNWERLPQEDPRDFVKVRSVGSSTTELYVEGENFKNFWILKIPIRDAVPLVKAVPPVIMVDMDPSLPVDPFEVRDATINQSPYVAMARAKSVVSSRDMDDYATAHTEDVHYLLVHSLMRGLNEAMIMSQRCITVKEDLATLLAKSIVDEAEMKNSKWPVAELTRDRKEALLELEKIKGAKAAVVSKFKASEAFEDINTRYFLSGFEAFKKQAAERFPELDFSVFQPYDDEDSVVDGGQDDQAGDDDVSLK
uniref:Uncharacterized protein n=1 Tax=Fagus sylvatica TaxID=28930 RepID=A0A2N9H3S8_FAGSY